MSPPTEHAQPPQSPTDQGDFGVFYKETLTPLQSYLNRCLGNRAEAQDIAQDAFLKTFEARASHPIDKLRAFLFVTARHLALNFRQRRASRVRPEEPAFIEAHAGTSPDFTQILMEQDAFDEAVRRLPPGCQQVLALRFKEGLSHAQIAQKLGLAPQTVANHVTRALRLLREHRADTSPK